MKRLYGGGYGKAATRTTRGGSGDGYGEGYGMVAGNVAGKATAVQGSSRNFPSLLGKTLLPFSAKLEGWLLALNVLWRVGGLVPVSLLVCFSQPFSTGKV